MAGAFVFPGGRVDPADADVPLSEDDRAWCHETLTPAEDGIAPPIDARRSVAMYVAAIRELFEEAGILLARPRGGRGGELGLGAPEWRERLVDARRRLNANEASFAALVDELEIDLDVRALTYWSHWLTPSAERRRYDTRFFVAMLPQGQVAAFDEIETTAQMWMGLEQAVVAHLQLAFFLAPPTHRTLEELRRFPDRPAFEAEAETTARRVPRILPKVVVGSEGIRVLLPWDPEYDSAPGEGEPVDPLPRQALGPSRVAVRRLQVDPDQEDRARAVLHFWFGDERNAEIATTAQDKRWWKKRPEVDEACKAFHQDIERAYAGEYDEWRLDPSRDLARIILLDQLPRNIFRGSGQAFAYDHRAVEWVLAGIQAGRPEQLPPIMRWFYYLPLMHAEALDVQERQVKLFEALRDEVSPSARPKYEDILGYAVRHRDIVARFGRFPHRNELLGRESTAEEVAFLAQPGSRF